METEYIVQVVSQIVEQSPYSEFPGHAVCTPPGSLGELGKG